MRFSAHIHGFPAPPLSSITASSGLEAYLHDWHRRQLDIDDLQNKFGLSGEGVRIVVVDTGVDHRGGGFDPDQVEAYHFARAAPYSGPVSASRLAFDATGHGTRMIGVLVGDAAPIAPEATVKSMCVSDREGMSYDSWLTKGLAAVEAWTPRPHIIAISLGAPTASAELRAIIQRLSASGVLVTAATYDRDPWHANYPAALQETIGVAAHDVAGALMPNGSAAANAALAAPGLAVLTNGKSGPTFMDGSSAATAVGAGVFALLLSVAKNEVERAALLPRLLGFLQRSGAETEATHAPRIRPLAAHDRIRRWIARFRRES